MTKKWILWRVLATLILAGLLIAGGVATYRAGWSQGYGASQLAAEGEEGVTLPYPPSGLGRIGRPLAFAPFAFGAGLLLKIVLGLVFLAVIGKLARFVLWGGMMRGHWPMHGYPADGPRAARRYHRRWMHGPMPPWCWDWDEPSDDEAKPDTGAAEA
ncbi:MAG: hypothetical protein U9R15_08455 [Chloroflexota bacterium]|nr:hypothetical protein [Chloroflexota bacterium]